MKKKRCSYCKEIIKEKAVGKLCKNCLSLREAKESLDFECRPPKTCFTCPYPDCVSPKLSRTHEEGQYLSCAGFKK